MNLYDVLKKQRDDMDENVRKICSMILQKAFLNEEKLPPYIILKGVTCFESKNRLNAVLQEAGIEIVKLYTAIGETHLTLRQISSTALIKIR